MQIMLGVWAVATTLSLLYIMSHLINDKCNITRMKCTVVTIVYIILIAYINQLTYNTGSWGLLTYIIISYIMLISYIFIGVRSRA